MNGPYVPIVPPGTVITIEPTPPNSDPPSENPTESVTGTIKITSGLVEKEHRK
jgi:hypothetical protein